MNYYKATRPDGTDFKTGTVNYAAALASGEVIRHSGKVGPAIANAVITSWSVNGKPDKPRKLVRNQPETYLSVSVEPADCAGFSWPCRLFRVEPVGRVMTADGLPNKRALSALRVVEELPAWMAFGPNGEAVTALIERCKTLTPQEIKDLAATRAAARAATRTAARTAARAAARAAAWDAARAAARAAAWDAVWDATWDAVWDATWAAVWAVLVKDLITPEQFDILYGPWAKVIKK